MHWPDTWLEKIEQAPFPADLRVSVRLLPVETAGDPDVQVAMELTTVVPVRAFSLALESEAGMLRVPWVWIEQARGVVNWRADSWGNLGPVMAGAHDEGDLNARVSPAGYLMSGGRYIVAYGFRYSFISAGTVRHDDPEIAPGLYRS